MKRKKEEEKSKSVYKNHYPLEEGKGKSQKANNSKVLEKKKKRKTVLLVLKVMATFKLSVHIDY